MAGIIYVVRGSEDGTLGVTRSRKMAVDRAVEYIRGGGEEPESFTRREIYKSLKELAWAQIRADSPMWRSVTVEITAHRPF